LIAIVSVWLHKCSGVDGFCTSEYETRTTLDLLRDTDVETQRSALKSEYSMCARCVLIYCGLLLYFVVDSQLVPRVCGGLT